MAAPVQVSSSADVEWPPAAVEKLQLEPGDTVVLRFAWKLTPEHVQRLLAHSKEWLPEGVKLAVFDSDVELSVLRPS